MAAPSKGSAEAATPAPASSPVVESPGVPEKMSVTAAPAVTRKLVSRVVGQAGDHVVTSREVQINFAIERVLYGRPADRKALTFLENDSKSFAAEVSNILLEWIVFLEAKSFSQSMISSQEVQKAVKTVQEGVAGLSTWVAFEVSGDELEKMVDRKLTAKKFMSFKADSSLVPVTDAEANDYFKKNRLKFGNMPFEAFRENIKMFLIKQQVDRRLKDWFEVLQRKYRVRNMVSGGGSH